MFGKDLPHSTELTSKLFCHLISDQYSPKTIGTVHAKLYPGDHFNPFSSPDKIYQLLKRLNTTLKKSFGFEIIKRKNKYQILHSQFENKNIEVNKQEVPLLSKPENIFKAIIDLYYSKRNFSSEELSEKMGVSKRTMNRWLKILSESDEVEKVGQGKNTKFKIAS